MKRVITLFYKDKFNKSRKFEIDLGKFRCRKDSPLTLKDELLVHQLYKNKICKPKELANKFNCNVRRIWFIIDRYKNLKSSKNILNVKRHHHCKFTIKKELDIVKNYLVGLSFRELNSRYDADTERIINEYGVNRSISEALHLYHGNKIPKFKFPLTEYAKSLIERGMKSNFKELIATLLLTDAHLSKRRTITMSSTSKIMCYILADFMFYSYSICPSSFFMIKSENINHSPEYVIGFLKKGYNMEKAIDELLTLSPSYKKSPSHYQTSADYLKEKQPTASFLSEIDKDAIVEATRIAISAEGSISPIFHSDSYKISPRLDFACANPKLVIEWQNIFKSIDIDFRIDKGKTWSGISGLETCKFENAKRFLDYGGFVDSVFVTNPFSNYVGLTKNEVLKALISKLNIPQDINRKEKHKVIYNLALGGESNAKMFIL